MEESNLKERFKAKMSDRLYKEFYSSKACKDSSRECVILVDSNRVTINSKSIWSSKLYAQKALKRMIDGKGIFINTNKVYGSIFGYHAYKVISDEFVDFGKKVREEWIKNHVKIVPLRDYMVLEHMRSKHGKERISKVI